MSTADRHAGRTVLVTGGSRNLGLAICERFARDGATVVINGVVPGQAEEEAARLQADGYAAYAIEGDVSDERAVSAMFDEINARFGVLDVLINNAALPMTGRVPLMDLTLTDWDRLFGVNARGTFLCTTAAVALMTGSTPSVINISSIGASKAHRSAAGYDATKGAVEAFTRAAALELAPRGIRVNAIAPGAISNDRYQALPRERQLSEVQPIPLGRAGSGADVAAAASFLASDDAGYITGQVLTVDGGLSAQARQASAEIVIDGPADHAGVRSR